MSHISSSRWWLNSTGDCLMNEQQGSFLYSLKITTATQSIVMSAATPAKTTIAVNVRDAVFSGPALPNSSAALDDVELDLVENILMRVVVAKTWGSEIDVDIEMLDL